MTAYEKDAEREWARYVAEIGRIRQEYAECERGYGHTSPYERAELDAYRLAQRTHQAVIEDLRHAHRHERLLSR